MIYGGAKHFVHFLYFQFFVKFLHNLSIIFILFIRNSILLFFCFNFLLPMLGKFLSQLIGGQIFLGLVLILRKRRRHFLVHIEREMVSFDFLPVPIKLRVASILFVVVPGWRLYGHVTIKKHIDYVRIILKCHDIFVYWQHFV